MTAFTTMNGTRSCVVLLLFGLTACSSSRSLPSDETPIHNSQIAERQAEVAQKGATVMPFDLDATTHIFEKQPEGGLQQVVSDSNDPEQIRLIREHVQEIATRFAAGNFHDPTMIHGSAMPGLHDLVMGYKNVNIKYSEIKTGAQIRYTSEDPALVSAIHAWFDAQVSDHGEHAQHNQ